MAIDEINAAGGVNGRPLKLEVTDIDMLTPEGVQTSFQTLADKKVDAIVSPFVITYQPALDVAAAASIPYLSGGTSSPTVAAAKANPDKYWNFVQDPSEAYYGSGFIQSLDKLVETGTWTPKNNKVDLVVGDSEYNQLIGEGAKRADRGQRRQVEARHRGAGHRRAAVRLVGRHPEAQAAPTPA